jgi:hypothetical protein
MDPNGMIIMENPQLWDSDYMIIAIEGGILVQWKRFHDMT